MRVAILGAGGVGLATAALLCRNGHDPCLWSPSGASTRALADGAPLIARGALSGSFRPRIATSCAEAVADAGTVIIAVPAYGHRMVMDAAAPYLRAEQTVIVSSHYSLSALYLARLLAERGTASSIAAWGTTVVMGRPSAPAEVTVLTIRARIDVATVPTARAGEGHAASRALFGDRFVERADLLAIQLSNVNPQAHLANALCNLTRMEKGEAWDTYGGITEAVSRLIEALDLERLAIARAFGVEVRTMREHMALSFDLPTGTSLSEATRTVEARGGSPGPTSLEARWIREDLPFGIVPLIALAEIAGVVAPLHRSGLALFSAVLGRDLAAENDLLQGLGLGHLTREELQALVRGGWRK
ncbi:MAG: NAD/NADP octopine/nopaline dehydrogenase family protein [Rhodospirillaceae bacterium]|nr:NAD/NADP octopine/nopaline dehydrogenase family protein [Rhodospirillaceae bacterium]